MSLDCPSTGFTFHPEWDSKPWPWPKRLSTVQHHITFWVDHPTPLTQSCPQRFASFGECSRNVLTSRAYRSLGSLHRMPSQTRKAVHASPPSAPAPRPPLQGELPLLCFSYPYLTQAVFYMDILFNQSLFHHNVSSMKTIAFVYFGNCYSSSAQTVPRT